MKNSKNICHSQYQKDECEWNDYFISGTENSYIDYSIRLKWRTALFAIQRSRFVLYLHEGLSTQWFRCIVQHQSITCNFVLHACQRAKRKLTFISYLSIYFFFHLFVPFLFIVLCCCRKSPLWHWYVWEVKWLFWGEENRVIVCAHNIAFVEHIIFINFNFTWDNVRSVWCVNFHILLSRSLSLFLWHSNGCDKLKSIKIINSPCLSRFTKTTQHSQSCHRCERARHWVSSFIIKYTKFWSIHWGIKTVIWIPTKKYIDCKVLSTKRQFYFSHSFCLRLVKSISYHQFSAVQIRSGKILVK